VQEFTLDGTAEAPPLDDELLRERGYRAEVLHPPHDPGAAELREVSDEWLAQGTAASAPSRLDTDEALLQECDVMAARAPWQDCRVANIIPSCSARLPEGTSTCCGTSPSQSGWRISLRFTHQPLPPARYAGMNSVSCPSADSMGWNHVPR
jgi:hypothetical protein